MLNIPDEIKALFKSDSVPKRYIITAYNQTTGSLFPADDLYPSDQLFPIAGDEAAVTIENDRLVSESVTITESISTDKDIVFGSCNSAELKFKCAGVDENLLGKELIVKLQIGSNYTVPIGSFFVAENKRSADRKFREITAYDRMTLFDVDVANWYKSLWQGGIKSITIRQMRDSLCAYIGVVPVDTLLAQDNISATQAIHPKEVSGRTILEAICEINGVFARINRYGQLEFIKLDTSQPVETIPIPIRKGFDYEDYSVPRITAVNIRQEENDIGASVGSGVNAYVVQGNFLAFGKSAAQLTVMANNLLSQINGIQYIPIDLQCKGLPYLEPGDCIDVQLKTEIIRTVVLSRTLSGVQALTDDITAQGEQQRSATYGINKSILQLEGKSNVLTRTVEEMTSEITDLGLGLSRVTQTATQISTTVEDLEDGISNLTQTVEGFTLTVEKTTVAGSTRNSISLTSEGFETKTITVDATTESQVSSLISANSKGITLSVVNAADQATIQLSGGGITTQARTIRFTGMVTFDSLSGNGTSTINGGNITTGTIDASKVTVTNLSAANITTGNLSANRISGGTLDCSKMTVSNLSAGSITSGTLDASRISVTNLSANSITSGTLSADRIDVDSLRINTLYVSNKVSVTASSSSIFIGGDTSAASFTTLYLYASSSVYITSWSRGISNGLIVDISTATLRPSSTLQNWHLGTSGIPFGSVYSDKIYAKSGPSSWYVYIDNANLTTNHTSGTLGASSTPWNRAYITSLYIGGSTRALSAAELYSGSTNYLTLDSSRQLVPHTAGSSSYPYRLGSSSLPFYYAHLVNLSVTSGTISLGSSSAYLGFFGTSAKARQTLSLASNNMSYSSVTASNYLYALNNLIGILKNQYGLIV